MQQQSGGPSASGICRFRGKIAIVAGGGQGIGSATARRLAKEGAAVVVADMVEASAQRVCNEITEYGVTALPYAGDLSKLENAQGLMKFTKESFGRIDVLINIVGGTIWWQPFQHYRPEQIEAEVNKSFWPPVWGCWSVLPYMLAQKSGAIVNLATHAVIGLYRIPYAASKGGVIGLTTSLAQEVAPYGIRVNCVAPGGGVANDRVTPRTHGVTIPETQLPQEVREEMRNYLQGAGERNPMGRPGLADEQAAAIAFLASDDASFITGQVLPVGGGQPYPL